MHCGQESKNDFMKYYQFEKSSKIAELKRKKKEKLAKFNDDSCLRLYLCLILCSWPRPSAIQIMQSRKDRKGGRRAWTVRYQGTAMMVVLVHGLLSLMFFFHIQEKSPNLSRIQRRSIACPCINKHTCIVMYHFEDLVKNLKKTQSTTYSDLHLC